MSPLRSRSLLALLVLLISGALVMTGCSASAPAAYAAAATAVTAMPAATNQPLQPAGQVQAAGDLNRTITVVGHGEVQAKPDVARSNIGIEVMAPSVADAMKEANARMDAVLKALKDAGIADKDIQTSNFSINFERQGPPTPLPSSSAGTAAETQPAGVYRVNNMVNVTIRDLSKVGAVVDAAVNAGANNVWGINFALDKTDVLEGQAREKAITDARARAESLAKLTGVSVGQVISVSEVIANPVTRYAAEKAMGGGGGTPVEPGEVSFSTDIQVVYAIR